MLRTFEELETVHLQWKEWQNHPNNDFDQFKKICRLRPDVESPFVVSMKRNGFPHALLVGRLEMTQFRPAIGYLSPVKIPARIVVVIHQGVLGQMDEGAATDRSNNIFGLCYARVRLMCWNSTIPLRIHRILGRYSFTDLDGSARKNSGGLPIGKWIYQRGEDSSSANFGLNTAPASGRENESSMQHLRVRCLAVDEPV